MPTNREVMQQALDALEYREAKEWTHVGRKAIDAQLAKPDVPKGWDEMSSAPKTGEEILVKDKHGDSYVVQWIDDSGYATGWWTGFDCADTGPIMIKPAMWKTI